MPGLGGGGRPGSQRKAGVGARVASATGRSHPRGHPLRGRGRLLQLPVFPEEASPHPPRVLAATTASPSSSRLLGRGFPRDAAHLEAPPVPRPSLGAGIAGSRPVGCRPHPRRVRSGGQPAFPPPVPARRGGTGAGFLRNSISVFQKGRMRRRGKKKIKDA